MRIKVENGALLGAVNALGALAQWVRPGKIAFLLGQLSYALQSTAKLLHDQREALIDELVVMVPREPGEGEVVPEGAEPEQVRKTVPGQYGEEYDFGPRRKEFERRNRELLDTVTEVDVQRLLTEADIERIEQDIDKGKGRKAENLPAVDFAALSPLIEGMATKVE